MNRETSPSKQPERKLKIVAAIPCLNEDRCIGSVVLKVKKYVDSVVVIDHRWVPLTYIPQAGRLYCPCSS